MDCQLTMIDKDFYFIVNIFCTLNATIRLVEDHLTAWPWKVSQM